MACPLGVLDRDLEQPKAAQAASLTEPLVATAIDECTRRIAALPEADQELALAVIRSRACSVARSSGYLPALSDRFADELVNLLRKRRLFKVPASQSTR